jgi:hypothetical protein
MKITINKAYDIASALLTDSAATVRDISGWNTTIYRVEKDTLRMDIYAPHGGGFRNGGAYRGLITLSDGKQQVFEAATRCPVGPAMDCTNSRPVLFATRMLSPKYFSLLDMANARMSGSIKTQDNTVRLHKCMSDIKAR